MSVETNTYHHHHIALYDTVVFHAHPHYWHDESEPVHFVLLMGLGIPANRDEEANPVEVPVCRTRTCSLRRHDDG